MPEELTYKEEAAAGYDRAFARVTTHFIPFLMRAAHVAPGMRVLDIAAGTGLAAEAALAVVGTSGHVTAADFSPAMVEKARQRLGNAKNVSLKVEDGQAFSFSDESFDRWCAVWGSCSSPIRYAASPSSVAYFVRAVAQPFR